MSFVTARSTASAAATTSAPSGTAGAPCQGVGWDLRSAVDEGHYVGRMHGGVFGMANLEVSTPSGHALHERGRRRVLKHGQGCQRTYMADASQCTTSNLLIHKVRIFKSARRAPPPRHPSMPAPSSASNHPWSCDTAHPALAHAPPSGVATPHRHRRRHRRRRRRLIHPYETTKLRKLTPYS